MIVKNVGKRICILGDRVRVGKGPGEATRIDPGQEVEIKGEVSVKAARRAIEKGWPLVVVDAPGMTAAEVAEKAKADRLAAFDSVAAEPKVEPEPEDKRGPGRPKKRIDD